MLELVPLQGAAGGIVLIFGLISLAMTALWIYVAYWVYTDANDRGMDSATLWGVITFLTGLIGLVIYFLIREDKPQSAAY